MSEKTKRRAAAAACGIASVLLTGVSIWMNYQFWAGNGVDHLSARAFGVASLGIDLLKVALPIVIVEAAGAGRRRSATFVSIAFVGCLAFSVGSAIGYAWSTRASAVSGRAANAQHLAAAQRDTRVVTQQRDQLAKTRPRQVVMDEIAMRKLDRRWQATKECTDIVNESGRQFCIGLAHDRTELGWIGQREALDGRLRDLAREIERLEAAGARQEVDPQASIFAKLTGIDEAKIQIAVACILAVSIEIGAAFGFCFAALAMRGPGSLPQELSNSQSKAVTGANPSKNVGGLRRLARGPNGQLLIE